MLDSLPVQSTTRQQLRVETGHNQGHKISAHFRAGNKLDFFTYYSVNFP